MRFTREKKNTPYHLYTKQSQVCQKVSSKAGAQTVNFLLRYFLPDLPLWVRTASECFSSFSHWLCSLFSLASHLFPSCCFPAEHGVDTPLPGCWANSRPWDCMQESENCITACGGRGCKFWLREKGRVCVCVCEMAATDVLGVQGRGKEESNRREWE